MLGGTEIPLLGLILVAFGGTGVYGSVIIFEAYPAQLKNNLTSSASMRCSLADNPPNGGQFGKRSRSRPILISTPDDIVHIHDISVTRNYGTEVAYLATFETAMAKADLGNLQVKGHMTGPSTEGYLELTWEDPSMMVMGEYVCQIDAVRASNHSVMFKTTLEMTKAEPSIIDVIASFNLKYESQQQQIENMTRKYDEEITSLKEGQVENDRLQQELQYMTLKYDEEITSLKECVSPNIAFTATFARTGHFKVDRHATVVYGKTLLNEGGAYNNITGDFHCTVAGVYNFDLTMRVPSRKFGCVQLKHNGNAITSVLNSDSVSATLKLKHGDVVNVYEICYSSWVYQGRHKDGSFNGNMFTGHLVKADKCLVLSN